MSCSLGLLRREKQLLSRLLQYPHHASQIASNDNPTTSLIYCSDWFVFAFPSEVPYEKFSVRIEEEDFLKDPHSALDQIKARYPLKKQTVMREHMEHWARYLSYAPQIAEANASSLQSHTPHDMQSGAIVTASDVTDQGVRDEGKVESIRTVIPFELMLREMRHHHLRGIEDSKAKAAAGMKSAAKKSVPLSESDKADRFCYSPHSCSTRVSALPLSGLLNETRSHICAHRSRFVGRYKMVYFMQCVRMLWPIAPAAMKSVDLRPGGLSLQDQSFIKQFHNVSKNTTSEWYSSWVTYPVGERVREVSKLAVQ
jgi:hypothetical protein